MPNANGQPQRFRDMDALRALVMQLGTLLHAVLSVLPEPALLAYCGAFFPERGIAVHR